MQAQIRHANYRCAARVKRQVLKSPPRIEAPHAVIERMGNDTHSPDALGNPQSGFQGVVQQVSRAYPLAQAWPKTR